MVNTGVFSPCWGENLVFAPLVLDDRKPLRIQMAEGVEPVLELLLVPDSSGKVAAHLMFTEYARRSVNILTLMQVPQILLEMRVENDPRWEGIAIDAQELCTKAVFLLKNGLYDDDDK